MRGNETQSDRQTDREKVGQFGNTNTYTDRPRKDRRIKAVFRQKKTKKKHC